jgi:transposase
MLTDTKGERTRQVTRIGLDIAKNVFQVHGVNEQGKVVVQKQLSRSKVLTYFAQLPACRIGREACGSAHYGARELQKLGHDVRLMAVQLIKPYRTKQKNDRNDAEAICEAVSRPQMRVVPIKTVEQQAVLTVHRARELLGSERTAVANQIRGLLMEYGKVIPPGIQRLRRELPAMCNLGLSDMAVACPGLSVDQLEEVYATYIREDTLAQATATLVNFQMQQPLGGMTTKRTFSGHITDGFVDVEEGSGTRIVAGAHHGGD